MLDRPDPAKIVLTQLRIRERLRAALEQVAKKNQTSLNAEIVRRLEASLEIGAMVQIDILSERLETVCLRLESLEKRAMKREATIL